MNLEIELSKPTVIYGVGAPGSGKTTKLRPYAQEIGAAYLNPDEIRKSVLGDEFNRIDDNLVWDILNTSVKLALKASRHVVVDAKNNDPNYRRQDTASYKQYGAQKVVAVYFKRKLEACLANNQRRTRPIPEEDVKKVHQSLEQYPPQQSEGFDEVVELELDD